MALDLDRMLERCRRGQWRVGDLDWSRAPRAMSPEDEQSIVQLFWDMAGIERLAGALFREQARRTSDPTLRAIFESFVVDEVRHSHAAQMLADHYDRRHLCEYRESESLRAFTPVFVATVRELADDIANAYIVAGELILDIALLRSIDDFVGDEMSHAAMALINRDEARHIAVDYHMAEYYASPAYAEVRRARPTPTVAARARTSALFVRLLYYAQPFIQDIFLRPMERLDPRGQRLREAFKRMQILGMREKDATLPFSRFLRAMQGIFNHPVAGRVLAGPVGRITGVGKFTERFYTEAEIERAREMSYAELADEALRMKGID